MPAFIYWYVVSIWCIYVPAYILALLIISFGNLARTAVFNAKLESIIPLLIFLFRIIELPS
jgi:hypothetical protein